MSDKITKTVTFEIEPSGNCSQCLSEFKINNCLSVCLAFGDMLNDYKQCQACKDYLEAEKAKIGRVYCKECFYFNGESCGKWNETKKDSDNQIYSKNCTDREE